MANPCNQYSTNGWTPELALVDRGGGQEVQQVVDWHGGTGTKPQVGVYVGPNGFTSDINEAVVLGGQLGPQGAQGAQGAQGPVGSQGAQGSTGSQGSSGSQGPQGPQGHQGASIPATWVTLTQAAYNALPVKDPATFYLIYEE